MFGFGKKIEIKQMDINEGYRNYVKDPDHIQIICVDELVSYDQVHIADSQCLPFRLLKDMEEYYPEKDITYYVYSSNKALSLKAAKVLTKKDYHVFDLGSFFNYREAMDGMSVSKKYRKKK